MTRSSVGLASLTGLALLAAFWLGRTSAPVGSAATPRPASESAAPAQPGGLAADGSELETAHARIRELEAQAAWLQAHLDSLRKAAREGGSAAATTPLGRQSGGGQRGADGSEFDGWESGEWESEGSEPEGSEFDAAALLARGASPSEIERLRLLSGETEMEQGDRELQAQRERGEKNRRDREERLESELALRAEIGDAAYDEMLYESGANNRVKIRKLLENAGGLSFGLELGDVVLRYDGSVVFTPQDLRRAANQGEPGGSVPVEGLRNGEPFSVIVPSGPIPARLGRDRVAPGGWW